MSVVVWKSPKALRGILRMLFGVKAPPEAKNKNAAGPD